MRSEMTMLAIALLACASLQGVRGTIPGLEKVDHSALIGASHCAWSCSGDEEHVSVKSEGVGAWPKTYECWGLFKVWCGPADNATTLSGSGCQGHFKSLRFNPGPSSPGKEVTILMCEGAHGWISSHVSTCPHTGHKSKEMMGTFTAGTAVTKMEIVAPPAAPSELTPVSAARAAVAADAMMMTLVGRTPAITVAADKEGARAVGADHVFKLEARSLGFSKEWRVKKQLPPNGPAGTPLGWEDLESEARDLLEPRWSDWLPSGSPPHPSAHGEGFSLLCNGKDAWLHGAVPCWGNFSVANTFGSHDEESCGDKAATKRAAASTTTAATATSRRALRSAGSALELQHPLLSHQPLREVEEGRNVTASMTAECDGLWSGALGHFCEGISTSHLEVARDGVEVPIMDKFSICSGRQGLKFIHHSSPEVHGMAVSCKGGKVVAVTVTKPPPE